MKQTLEYNFQNDYTVRCRGKSHSDKYMKEGEYFGYLYVSKIKWAIVLWDDDSEPELYKADLIEAEKKMWEDVD